MGSLVGCAREGEEEDKREEDEESDDGLKRQTDCPAYSKNDVFSVFRFNVPFSTAVFSDSGIGFAHVSRRVNESMDIIKRRLMMGAEVVAGKNRRSGRGRGRGRMIFRRTARTHQE